MREASMEARQRELKNVGHEPYEERVKRENVLALQQAIAREVGARGVDGEDENSEYIEHLVALQKAVDRLYALVLGGAEEGMIREAYDNACDAFKTDPMLNTISETWILFEAKDKD